MGSWRQGGGLNKEAGELEAIKEGGSRGNRSRSPRRPQNVDFAQLGKWLYKEGVRYQAVHTGITVYVQLKSRISPKYRKKNEFIIPEIKANSGINGTQSVLYRLTHKYRVK